MILLPSPPDQPNGIDRSESLTEFFSQLIICQFVNENWEEFNPSPLSTRYFSVPELNKLLHENRFNVEFYGVFSALPKGFKEKLIATIKKIAVTLHLIHKTMKAKEFLKRIFFGKLIPMPPEVKDGIK